MKSYYKFANVVMEIEHNGDDLFRHIDDEIKYYHADRMSFIEDKYLYAYDHKTYIFKKNNFVIIMDYKNKNIAVNYLESNLDIYSTLRGLIKWLFIKSAEDKGLVYIHGAAINYKGKNIVLTGDSNSGKSSSLLRFIQDGAKVISDDSVILDGDRLVPFTLKTKIDEDSAKRFNLKPDLFDIGKHMDHEKDYRNVDMVLFLKVWNNETSEFKPLLYEQALLNLMRIYKKEIRFTVWSNWDKKNEELSRFIFEKYSSILKGAKCFEFYAGYDEPEVRKKLLGFLDGY